MDNGWEWIIHINSPWTLGFWILLKQTISLGQGEVPMTERDVVGLQNPKFDPYGPYPFYRLQSQLLFFLFSGCGPKFIGKLQVTRLPLIIPSIQDGILVCSQKFFRSFPTRSHTRWILSALGRARAGNPGGSGHPVEPAGNMVESLS
jgi:hypothetical protein